MSYFFLLHGCIPLFSMKYYLHFNIRSAWLKYLQLLFFFSLRVFFLSSRMRFIFFNSQQSLGCTILIRLPGVNECLPGFFLEHAKCCGWISSSMKDGFVKCFINYAWLMVCYNFIQSSSLILQILNWAPIFKTLQKDWYNSDCCHRYTKT